jgi:hypothetical protein
MFSEVFSARVVIPTTEFAALGLGEHEDPSELPACFRWCFDRLGPGGTRWLAELTDPAVVILCFKQPEDAIAFVAQWKPCRSGDHQAASLALSTQTSLFGAMYPGLFEEASSSQDDCPDWCTLVSPETVGRTIACGQASLH